MPDPVPAQRIRALNQAAIHADRAWVVYWMIAARRTRSNFALQRAVELATALRKPLIVFEPLRCGYPWASERLHAFVLQGMHDNAASLARSGALYFPYVEPRAGDGEGLLQTLAARAAVIVTDDYPAFFLPRMLAAAARKIDVRLEAVDSNGLMPFRAAEGRVFTTAFSFRAFLQRSLRPHLEAFPADDPLQGVDLPSLTSLPPAIAARWPAASKRLLAAAPAELATLPIDHRVEAGLTRGGARAAHDTLRIFLDNRLARYVTDRARPEADATSGLSPYLHFGHVSVHEVFAALMTREGWTTRRLRPPNGGKREGWWGASPAAAAFLDELVTWREVGFNTSASCTDYDRYESLPDWARASLAAHASDPRPHRYTLEKLEAGETYDPLWNAAQMQLVREGRIHNYLRMLWGKKVLEWSPSPEDALAAMIHLNNKYALDGRDPNSYSGIFWCLGRYDRPWGPERPIFGTIRYMSSENTARKVPVKGYIRKYAPSDRSRPGSPPATLFD